MTETESSSLRDLLNVPFKHWGMITGVFLISVLVAIGYLMVVEKQYTATSKLLVGLGREKTAPLALEREPGSNFAVQERQQDINNEIEILRDPSIMAELLPELRAILTREPAAGPKPSPTVLSELRERLVATVSDLRRAIDDWREKAGLLQRLTPEQGLMANLLSALSVELTKETDVVSVSFRWSDPQTAAAVANLYVKTYRDRRVKIYRIGNSLGFYKDQLVEAEKELDAAAKALAQFLQNGQITSFESEKQLALNYVGELDKELAQTRISVDDTRQKMDSIEARYRLKGVWIDTPDVNDSDGAIQALDQRFVSLSTERTDLLAKFKASYPAVVSIDQQLATLRDQKYAALKAQYGARLATMQKRASTIEAKIKVKKDELAQLSERTTRLEQLVQRRDQQKQDVARYAQKVEELRIREDLDAQNFTSVRIISEAVPPPLPSAPKKALILGLAALMGLLFGLALAVISEFFNHTFRHERDIQRVLGIPVLSTVPRIGR